VHKINSTVPACQRFSNTNQTSWIYIKRMIEIQNFLRKPTKAKFSLEALAKNPELFYSALNEYSMLNDKFGLDDYSRGVVVISYNDDLITNFMEHDLIIPYWINLLAGVIDFINTGKGIVYFQDWAGCISFSKSFTDFIELNKIHGVENIIGTWYVPEKEFLLAVYNSGVIFNEFLISNGLNYSDLEIFLKEIEIFHS
jgi:hypothetical protein